jgi:hypothetical protein
LAPRAALSSRATARHPARANAKVFLRCAGHCQHACSLLDSIRIQVHRVKNARSNEMAENCGGDWDEDQ